MTLWQYGTSLHRQPWTTRSGLPTFALEPPVCFVIFLHPAARMTILASASMLAVGLALGLVGCLTEPGIVC